MSSDPFESEVRQFYADATLSEDRVDAILAHGQSVAAARFWKRSAIAAGIGMAAMLLLCISLALRLQSDQPVANLPAQPVPQTQPATPVPDGLPAAADQTDSPRYRLIAVRSHGDRCPHCRAAGHAFDQLEDTLAGQPIDFTFIDLRRNSDRLDESEQLFDSLDLNRLVADQRDKALIALAGPDGKLEPLDASLGPERLTQQVAAILSAR